MDDEAQNPWEAKQEARRERYLKRAEAADQEAADAHAAAKRISDLIPFGQPILVGHHSEGRHRRDLDRIHRGHKKAVEASDKAEHYRAKADGVGNAGISSDDPEAITKLKAELAELELKHQRLKQLSAALRLNIKDKQKGNQALKDLGYSDAEIPRLSIRSWQLPYASANIRRVKQRITDLERMRSRPVAQPRTVAGVRIEEDAAENRLRLTFPGKPAPAIISALKANGFRWSPRQKAWQRQRSPAATYAAERVLAAVTADADEGTLPEAATPPVDPGRTAATEAQPDAPPKEAPYWEAQDGWDDAGNCLTCGEAGRCECFHPILPAPRRATCRHSTPCGPTEVDHG